MKQNGIKRNIASMIEWLCVAVCITATFGIGIKPLGMVSELCLPLTYVAILVFTWVHGSRRYGFKNMLVWFGISFVVTVGLEGLSIKTGWPFGDYYYVAGTGPQILGVPVWIMLVYFAIGYISWTTVQVLVGKMQNRLHGKDKFIIPFTAAIVMTMFDLCRDPLSSTSTGTWVWLQGGDYFGVPLSNFSRWVFTVYVFMQIFAFYISSKMGRKESAESVSEKGYWLKSLLLYLCMGVSIIMLALKAEGEYQYIYNNMALISVFTMIFVAWIALVRLEKTKM